MIKQTTNRPQNNNQPDLSLKSPQTEESKTAPRISERGQTFMKIRKAKQAKIFNDLRRMAYQQQFSEYKNTLNLSKEELAALSPKFVEPDTPLEQYIIQLNKLLLLSQEKGDEQMKKQVLFIFRKLLLDQQTEEDALFEFLQEQFSSLLHFIVHSTQAENPTEVIFQSTWIIINLTAKIKKQQNDFFFLENQNFIESLFQILENQSKWCVHNAIWIFGNLMSNTSIDTIRRNFINEKNQQRNIIHYLLKYMNQHELQNVDFVITCLWTFKMITRPFKGQIEQEPFYLQPYFKAIQSLIWIDNTSAKTIILQTIELLSLRDGKRVGRLMIKYNILPHVMNSLNEMKFFKQISLTLFILGNIANFQDYFFLKVLIHDYFILKKLNSLILKIQGKKNPPMLQTILWFIEAMMFRNKDLLNEILQNVMQSVMQLVQSEGVNIRQKCLVIIHQFMRLHETQQQLEKLVDLSLIETLRICLSSKDQKLQAHICSMLEYIFSEGEKQESYRGGNSYLLKFIELKGHEKLEQLAQNSTGLIFQKASEIFVRFKINEVVELNDEIDDIERIKQINL